MLLYFSRVHLRKNSLEVSTAPYNPLRQTKNCGKFPRRSFCRQPSRYSTVVTTTSPAPINAQLSIKSSPHNKQYLHIRCLKWRLTNGSAMERGLKILQHNELFRSLDLFQPADEDRTGQHGIGLLCCHLKLTAYFVKHWVHFLLFYSVQELEIKVPTCVILR